MTDPVWRAAKMKELYIDHGDLASRLFTVGLSHPDRRLLKHIRRELDYYEMQIMKPNFDRMEKKQIRQNMRIARSIQTTVERLQKAQPRNPT